MTSQRFTDALSGADGTQAPRLRYDVSPVYPDATVPVAAVRPMTVPIVTVRIPEIDPRVAAALSASPVARTAERPRPTAPRGVPAAPRPGLPPAVPPPSRAQAARAGYYQGPVPTAVAPAAPSRHRPFPAAPTATTVGAADRLRAQLSQFGTGNVRSQPAMPSSPQAGPRSSVPASAFQPPPPPQQSMRRRTRGGQSVIVVIILFLIVTGVGSKIIDAVLQLIQR